MFSVYGHLSRIGWGSESNEGLRAEYGRLQRCLAGHEICPNGANVFVWRFEQAQKFNEALQETFERVKGVVVQMELFRARLRSINDALNELGSCDEVKCKDTDQKKPVNYVRLLRGNNTVVRSTFETEESAAPEVPKVESERVKKWVDKHIRKMEQGNYDVLEASQSLSDANLWGNETEDEDAETDTLQGHTHSEESSEGSETDDEEFLTFLDEVAAMLRKGNGRPPLTEVDDEHWLRKHQHVQVKRILHVLEMEMNRLVDIKNQLEFRRTEHVRVTHYWTRMQQIKATFAEQGFDIDKAAAEIRYDPKQPKIATPPPEPEQPPW